MTVQVGLMVSLWQRQGHLHHHKTLVRYAVQHRRGSCLRTITALLQFNRKECCLQHWETWTRTPQTEGAALTTTQVGLCERAALEQCFAKLQILQLLAQHGSAQQTAT